MLQWATEILRTCEALCVWMCNMSKVNKLPSDSVCRSKVGPKGQFWSSPSTNLLLLSLELLGLNEKRSHMQHALQTETVSSLKGFFANVPEHFSYLQTSLTEGVGAAERIGTFILLGFFTIALQIGYTQTLLFTFCFLFWLQQTCVSTGRQPPLRLPAQKRLIFIIVSFFLEISKHWHEN